MSSDDRTLPALSTRSRRRNREPRYDRFPSRKRERSPAMAGVSRGVPSFHETTKGANNELRTRAATSCKKRTGSLSARSTEQNLSGRGERSNAMTRGNSISEIFPEELPANDFGLLRWQRRFRFRLRRCIGSDKSDGSARGRN